MLLMVENGIRAGICHAIHWCVKANNKYIKDYNRNKESSYLIYWGINNLFALKMTQNLPVNGFKWVEIL